jgi:diguanylate cyclase (GGDEF)-like protein/PAS domain S-box-containing protein
MIDLMPEGVDARKREERLLALEHSVTRRLAEAENVPAALESVIRTICESEGWECGRYLRVDERAGVLRCVDTWGIQTEAIERFLTSSCGVTYAPGAGHAGRVWQSGQPLWLADVGKDGRAVQTTLIREIGLHGAIFFPVKADGKTIGVLAFNSREVRELEERLLQALHVIGSQIGQFLRRKESEEELRRFRAAMDASADLILLVDPVKLRYLDVNDTACRALGYSREEFLAMGPQDIFSISREELTELYNRLFDGDKSEERVEGWYRRKDGSKLEVESFRRAVKSSEGNMVVAVARDITERRGREEDLRRFRLAMDNSADMIVLIDRATMRFVDVNATACDLLGYSREEMLKMGPHDLLPVSRAELERSYDDLIANPSLTSGMNTHYRCRDGTLLPFESTRRVLRSGDTYIIAAISRDIRDRIAAETALRESNERFNTAVRATSDVIWDLNLITESLWWNENFTKVFGYPREDVDRTVKSWYDATHPDDRDRVEAGMRRLIDSGGESWSDEYRFRRRDGSYAEVLDRGHVIRDSAGKAVRMIGAMEDVTSRKEGEEKMRKQALQQRLIAEFGQWVLASTGVADVLNRAVELVSVTLKADYCNVLELDPDGKQLLFKAATGWPAEWIGQRTVPVRPGNRVEFALSHREPVITKDYEDKEEETRFAPSPLLQFGVRSGVEVPIFGTTGTFGILSAHSLKPRRFGEDDLSFLQSVANILALAVERKGAEERLAYLAQFDALTTLPNRHLFHDRLLQTMAQGRRSGNPMAVLYIDLDRFKLVNDTQGHGAGDKLLKEAAARLTQCIRSGDTVGRFGGDEFGAVLSDLAKPGDASIVAQKMIDALARPFDLDGHETYVSASVGITLFPGDSEEAGALIMNADTAMYRAKEQGRSTYQYFTREMNERALARMQVEAALRRGLERREFLLHYQPKVDLESGVICGFEALLRWQHPERGMVSPVEFIPVLEDAGLIVPVGEWVMREVCRQIQAWKGSGLSVPPVAVNLSARQFLQKDLEATVRLILRESGVDPSLIQFELTESLLMKEPEAAARTLRGLKESGVRISVDDFGTGYSSLAYLKRFPIDALKIDHAFIRDVTTNPEDAAIALAIIGLAHGLKLKVVAEGVETEGQLNFLSMHACDEMQGYYFSRPVPPSECEAMLREGRRLSLSTNEAAAKPAVLLLDDDERDLLLLEEILRPDGFQVLKTTDPARAFELLASHPVGIVISDQNMPRLTGVEFLSHVRKLYPEVIRIVFTSSQDPKALADAVNEAGIHKFIMKDWDRERLRAEVREVSRRYRPKNGAIPSSQN